MGATSLVAKEGGEPEGALSFALFRGNMLPRCHPELHAHYVDSSMQAVGRMGVSSGPGEACQPRQGTKARSCRCLVVTPRPKSIRVFYGDASHSVAPLTLYFGDGPRDASRVAARHEHVAVSRVGIPGDGINPLCSGGSAVRISIGKAGQLECRRAYAKRLGCQYEASGCRRGSTTLRSRWIAATFYTTRARRHQSAT